MRLSDSPYKRSSNLQLIRFLAALAVIVSHGFTIATGTSGNEFIDKTTGGVLSLGGISVCIFFACGGYLIARSVTKNNTFKGYFKARITRIFPPLILVVVMCVILGAFLTTLSAGEYFTNTGTYKYLLNAVLVPVHELPGVFQNNYWGPTVNGPLWTLPVEFGCYVFCFIAYKLHLLEKKHFIFTLPVPVAAVIAEKFMPEMLASAVRPCVLFYIGMMFYVYREYIEMKWYIAAASLAGIVCGIAFGFPNIAMYLFLPYLLFYISFSVPQVPEWLGKTGDISYSLYLWGCPVQQSLVFLFATRNPYVNCSVAACIAIPLAIGTYFAAEKPFMKKKSSKKTA